MRKFYSEKITLVVKLCSFYSVICGTHKTQKSRNTLREKCPHPELLPVSIFPYLVGMREYKELKTSNSGIYM